MTEPARPQPVPMPEGEQYLAPKKGLLEQPWVRNYLPFITSLAVHLGIILAGFGLIASGAATVIINAVTQEQAIVADAAFVDDGDIVGGIQNPGLNDDPTRQAAQMNDQDVEVSDAFSEQASDLDASLMEAGDDTASAPVFGRGAAPGPPGGIGGGPAGGDTAPFGRPGGGAGQGPPSKVFGNTSNLRSAIFVCDASGSMIGERSILLKRELTNTVNNFSAAQFFNVIFFQTGQPQVLNRGQLLNGSTNNKRLVDNFLTTVDFSAGTDPIPGLEEAFRQRPQLIWLLTDGDFPDPTRVINTLDRLNVSRETQINTILFLNEDESAEATLRQIAADHGGDFKKITKDQVR
ncbi:MAG: hypothetical protein AAF743_12245 [Planctomycetota bacterium]